MAIVGVNALTLKASRAQAPKETVLNVTRIHFRFAWHLPIAALRFWQLYRRSSHEPDLVRGEISVSGLRTLTNISIWRNRRAMLLWSGRAAHVAAVQWTYGKTSSVWSADWTIRHQSPSATNWNGTLPTVVSMTENALD
jgi:hypothetical protein